MGKKQLPPGWMWDRPVPSRWAEELAQLAPPTERDSWLLLAWMSGDPWERQTLPDGSTQVGVQRWCIYEMIPLRIWWGTIMAQRKQGKQDADIYQWQVLEALNGPHPRDLGHYDEVLDRFISDAEVTRQEWELFRQHKAIPILYWIIQGKNGGHKRTFSPLEQKLLQLKKLPAEAPNPGSLPYADFDQQVLMQLARRLRIHQSQRFLSPLEAERGQQAIEVRRQILDWLENQVREDLEAQPLDISNMKRSSDPKDDPTPKWEEAAENFLNTGRTDSPQE
jgi:hypothetical protein